MKIKNVLTFWLMMKYINMKRCQCSIYRRIYLKNMNFYKCSEKLEIDKKNNIIYFIRNDRNKCEKDDTNESKEEPKKYVDFKQ